MSFSSADIKELKWSLLSFALSLALAAVLVNYSANFQHQALQDRQTAQRQLIEARNQLYAAQNDQQNMASYQLEYEALQKEKVIGNEQRLDWIEGLEKLRAMGLVLDFKYSISPQQAYVPAPPLDSDGFALNFSPMTLQIDLLHEEQLLHLFSALHTHTMGWFMLDHCSLSGAETQGEAVSALKAECAGGWLTMKSKSAP